MSKLFDKDYRWDGSVDYDYQRETSCEESGCDMICRCSVITDTEITKVDVSSMAESIYEKYFGDTKASKRDAQINTVLFGTGRDIDIYTIDRILRINKVWESHNWDIEVCGGYYGQEIEGVRLDNFFANKLEQDILKALSIEDINKRIEFLLELEYGYLLPEMAGRKYSIVEIPKDDIIMGSVEHYKKVESKDLKHYLDNVYNGIRGVVIPSDSKYRLIDGYHRITSTKNAIVKVIKADK